MAVITPERQAAVSELRDRFRRSQALVLADFRGLNVAQATQLRKKLREAGVELRVVKNTLARIAFNEEGQSGLDPFLEGPTAIAFGFADPVAPAKTLVEFAKDNKQLQIKAGLVEGKVVGADEIKALAELPTREVLLAKMVGSLKSPLYGLANVLNGPLRNLVYAVEAVRKQKEGQAA